MTDPQGKELLQRIRDTYKEEGFGNIDKLAELLMEFRERAKVIEDPLLTKVTRMTAEHLKEYNDFLIRYVEQGVEEGEEGEEPAEVTPDEEADNFAYLLDLFADARNQYNREDLSDFRDILKVYPEPVAVNTETTTA